ncbi:MAG: hypothetical protein SW833_28015 [Cyanobacteriota bacterium]|nr:hypothetical protein [Cyanobacteriota bacterium]
MLRKTLLVLIGLAAALLLDAWGTPARAALPDTAVYHWEYSRLGQTQQVCKKIVLHPKLQTSSTPLGQHPVHIRSETVRDRYCSQQ